MDWMSSKDYGGRKLKEIIRFVKRLFGIYEAGYEYWIYTKDIKVDPRWRKTKIGKTKFNWKMDYWRHTGEFESKIILDRKFNLVDGYSSVRIAEIKGIDKVPVYFVN